MAIMTLNSIAARQWDVYYLKFFVTLQINIHFIDIIWDTRRHLFHPKFFAVPNGGMPLTSIFLLPHNIFCTRFGPMQAGEMFFSTLFSYLTCWHLSHLITMGQQGKSPTIVLLILQDAFSIVFIVMRQPDYTAPILHGARQWEALSSFIFLPHMTFFLLS